MGGFIEVNSVTYPHPPYDVELFDECTVRITGKLSTQQIQEHTSSIGSEPQTEVDVTIQNFLSADHAAIFSQQAVRICIDKIVAEVVSLRGFLPLSKPRVHCAPWLEGEISFSCEFLTVPNPQIKFYDAIPVDAIRSLPALAAIDKRINQLANSSERKVKQSSTEAVDMHDHVVIQPARFFNGETSDGDGQPIRITMGKGVLSKEVEAQLVGMYCGEVKTIHTKAGDQDCVYHVTVIELYRSDIPAINDEFARSLGVGAESLQELKTLILQQELREAQNSDQASLRSAICEHLAAHNPFRIPADWIQQELKNQKIMRPSSKILNEFSFTHSDSAQSEAVTKHLRDRVIIQAIARQEGLLEAAGDDDTSQLKTRGPIPSAGIVDKVFALLADRVCQAF